MHDATRFFAAPLGKRSASDPRLDCLRGAPLAANSDGLCYVQSNYPSPY